MAVVAVDPIIIPLGVTVVQVQLLSDIGLVMKIYLRKRLVAI